VISLQYAVLRSQCQQGVLDLLPLVGATRPIVCDVLLAALEVDSSAWWNGVRFERFAHADRIALQSRQPKERARWLLGRLWKCTDIAPATTCGYWDLPPGSSFAQLVRVLASSL